MREKTVGERLAGALILFISLLALMGAAESVPAQEAASGLGANGTVGPHEPLKGKECGDCHRRAVSADVNCLLAKADLCEICHEVPAEGGLTRQLESGEPVCYKCHKKDQFKGSYAHGPYAAGACETCHDPHGGAVRGMLRVTGSEMCLECHEDMRSRLWEARFRHTAAVKECLDCHTPHMSEQQHMLTTGVPGLCGKCHEKTVREVTAAVVKHSPVTEDAGCMNCHDPHGAQERGLLLADGLDICLKCHDEPVKDKEKKQEFADMKKLLGANAYPHGPIENRDCSACHNAHGSPYYRLLTEQYPEGFYAPFFVKNYALCFGCHESELATEERTTKATEFRDGDRNLHFLHVNKTSHGRACRSCHEVHASANPQEIAATVKFGNWELPVKYEKTEDGGSCAPGCHGQEKYSRQAVKRAE